jgi:hypothetical protein
VPSAVLLSAVIHYDLRGSRMIRRFMMVIGWGVLLSAAAAFSREIKHEFFVAGWNCGGPALYDAEFQQTWQHSSSDELSDGWVLPDGGIVYSFSKRKEKLAGVVRLGPDKKELWTYTAPNGSDNHSCQPLPHGGFLLGECAKDGLWMVELDAEGNELKRVKVADEVKDIHHAFRAVRKTPQNTYLGTLMKPAQCAGKTLAGGHAYEWDASGKLIHTFPSGFFHAVRLSNGNTLVSEGGGADGRGVTEYDADGTRVWALTSDDLKAAGLRVGMVCGLQRLPNGNTVVTNVKHGKHPLGLEGGEAPKAFEVTADKKVVWKVPASTSSNNMGSIQLLDVPGNPFKMEVFR